MNKRLLSQYCDLQEETKHLEERIEKVSQQEKMSHAVVQNRL